MKQDTKAYTIHQGDNVDILKTLEDNSIDSIVTDPPYGIEFLGKDWDSNTGAVETWRECLRVLKPGGYLLAFSAARTYHNLATNIEAVGFEIRDQIMWLYTSGFPKAQDIGKNIDRRITQQKIDIKAEYNGGKHGTKNVDLGMQGVRCPKCKRDSNARYGCKEKECGMIYKPQTSEAKQWAGWKTSLKPAHEPIVMARKPFQGSTIDNVLEYGTGALNIDATRIGFENEEDIKEYYNNIAGPLERSKAKEGDNIKMHEGKTGFKAQKGSAKEHMPTARFPSNVIGEVKDYQKYFYCPKVGRKERHIGFELEDIPTNPSGMYEQDERGKCGTRYEARVEKERTKKKDPLAHIQKPYEGKFEDKTRFSKGMNNYKQSGTLKRMKDKMHQPQVGNNHPTVKPVELMKYLVKLVTPSGGTVLDPFTGSGSTGMAAVELGHTFIGCELDPNYVDIANKRITAWNKSTTTFNKLFEEQL